MVAQIDKTYAGFSWSGSLVRLVSYALFEGRPLTTRGRWINPLVLANARRLGGSKRQASVDRPIFIIGTGRSGTTILGVVMSMHRRLGFLNEPKALWHTVIDNEDVVGNYTDKPARFVIEPGEVDDTEAGQLARIYSGYLRTVGRERVLDKYPELIFRMEMVLKLFPDARFLFLVRNGHDVCRSIQGWSSRYGQTSAGVVDDWWGRDKRKWRYLVEQLVPGSVLEGAQSAIDELTDQQDMAAVEWILTMQQGMAMEARFPESVCRVCYEDLAEAPEKTLAQILEFCGLPDDQRMMDYAGTVLTGRRPTREVELHPALRAPFNATLAALGYQSQADSSAE